MGGMAGGAAEDLVDGNEDVCRLCYRATFPLGDGKFPEEIDPETGLIRPEHLSFRDLKERGFSMQRVVLYTRQAAERDARLRTDQRRARGASTDGFKLDGILLANVAAITGIRDGKGGGVYRVLATPVDVSAAHAEIRAGRSYTRDEHLKYRLELRDVLGHQRPTSALNSEESPRSLQALASRCASLFRNLIARFR